MKKIGVLIVEDSEVVRQLLEHIIGGDPRFDILATVSSAEEALAVLQRVSPDVISLDIRLPGMNGFEATRHIMRDKPTPIVVVFGQRGIRGAEHHDERVARGRAGRRGKAGQPDPRRLTSE